MPVLDKHSDSCCIQHCVTRSETLIGTIKEGDEVLLFDSLTNLLPLLQSRVHSSWIVSTCMEQYYASSGHVLDILDHAVKVQIRIFSIVVAVFFYFKSSIRKNWDMVSPCWVRNIDLAVSMPFHEFSVDPKTASSRQRLNTMDAVFLQGGRVRAVDELERQINKFWISSDSGVFHIKPALHQNLFCLAHTRKDVWFSCTITIGANTHNNLLRKIVLLKRFVKPNDWIGRRHLKIGVRARAQASLSLLSTPRKSFLR
mmetsp:Transcript_36588/g.56779  ORF Transcript_36588/g.56779 Transcript_36588/m.56779 type:complete len:256 (-) Transcript_36588:110-877(-)